MPLSLKSHTNKNLFGLWEVKESLENLLQDFNDAPQEEKENLKKFKNPNRQIEWIATRLLIYELLGKKVIIDYDDFSKPSIRDDDRQISISHTKGMIAVQVNSGPAGIDVELISGRVVKIAHKFLSPIELDSIDLNQQMLHMYAYWGAKETIYKIYGKKKLDFKKHIQIEAFKIEKKGVLKANLKTGKVISYTLDYFIYNKNEENIYMIVKFSE